MAMRFNHSFGLMELEEKNKLIQFVSHIYDGFQAGLNQEEMLSKFSICSSSFNQFLEEIQGKGF